MSYLDLAKKAERELMAEDDAPRVITPLDEPVTQEAPPEALAASILAENTPDEAARILQFWKQTFGMDLDRVRVQEHLERWREWQEGFRR